MNFGGFAITISSMSNRGLNTNKNLNYGITLASIPIPMTTQYDPTLQ